MTFNTGTFMLQSKAAEKLYAAIQNLPIFDYHCHLDPREIYEDNVFEDIVDLWLKGDHYKWRLMRANGVSEQYITGNAPKKEKFKAWAMTLSKAFGNPLYHWSHLEMKQVFGIDTYISADNWEDIYDALNAKIKVEQLSPRRLIANARVSFIGTTDHPLDTLEWHQKLKEDTTFETRVAPTFRPDEAFVEHSRFAEFVSRLSETTHQPIRQFADFIAALEVRIDYFAKLGCRASDISFTQIVFEPASEAELNAIMQRALAGEVLSPLAINQWQTGVFMALCGLYKKYDLVTQVHFGALRNNNKRYYHQLGADTGFDSIGDQVDLAHNLNQLLNVLVETDVLPKMVFYNLNPAYNTVVANTLANFQANESGVVNPLQFGAAWWFVDSELGMLNQMKVLAEQGLLANFIGMLTDSRSFLSYQRHDYFRRILANLIGEWVEQGKVPDDEALLKPYVENIAYHNAVNYFEGK